MSYIAPPPGPSSTGPAPIVSTQVSLWFGPQFWAVALRW